MTGRTGARTNRPELVAAHGYDRKYAMHALRLRVQGVELLTTGRVSLPVPEPDTTWVDGWRHRSHLAYWATGGGGGPAAGGLDHRAWIRGVAGHPPHRGVHLPR